MARRSNNELSIIISNLSDKELNDKITENEERSEEGYNIFGGSFDNEILFGEDALIALNHDLYLEEMEIRSKR
jgi:hypothetical protein